MSHDPSPIPDDWPEVTIAITVTARVKPGYGPAEVGDAARFHLDLSDLDSVEADISAVRITAMREHTVSLPEETV